MNTSQIFNPHIGRQPRHEHDVSQWHTYFTTTLGHVTTTLDHVTTTVGHVTENHTIFLLNKNI